MRCLGGYGLEIERDYRRGRGCRGGGRGWNEIVGIDWRNCTSTGSHCIGMAFRRMLYHINQDTRFLARENCMVQLGMSFVCMTWRGLS